jgi:hypothetical protein
MTDVSIISVTLKIGKTVKKVGRDVDPPHAPKLLIAIEDAIDQASNSIQWVGNEEERGA